MHPSAVARAICVSSVHEPAPRATVTPRVTNPTTTAAAVMSPEQKAAAEKKLNSLQEDLDHVASKLQQAEQGIGQALLQEMAPKVQEVLKEIIQKDGIALLLQRANIEDLVGATPTSTQTGTSGASRSTASVRPPITIGIGCAGRGRGG